MRLRWRCASLIVLGLSLWLTAGAASAQPVEVPPTWGGDLWSRPRLTGSWFGLRDTLGQHGVVFDADLHSTLQGVASGGRDTGVEFWRNATALIFPADNEPGTSLLNATFMQFPALEKKLDSAGRLTDLDTAVVAGLRLWMRF